MGAAQVTYLNGQGIAPPLQVNLLEKVLLIYSIGALLFLRLGSYSFSTVFSVFPSFVFHSISPFAVLPMTMAAAVEGLEKR